MYTIVPSDVMISTVHRARTLSASTWLGPPRHSCFWLSDSSSFKLQAFHSIGFHEVEYLVRILQEIHIEKEDAMLVQESHVDVPTKADGQGSMRMYTPHLLSKL